MRRFLRARYFLLVGVTLAGVAALVLGRPASPGNSGRAWDVSNLTPVTVAQANLASPAPCEGRFVPHTLEVATGVRIREIGMYISNGSGLAVNDLDGDGLQDIVFASVDRESTILWNQGGLRFEAETLDDAFTRGVNIVDVNGDGRLDIAFTHTSLGGVTYWRNTGLTDGPRFVRDTLPGVANYAYAMAWGDLNGDGPLDLVTGSYNTDLRQQGAQEADLQAKAGLVVYERRGDRYVAQRLDPHAETLSVGLVDLSGDGRLDIWAANDFWLQDRVFLRRGDGWQAVKPFARTSHSTMSLEWGDIDNTGRLALFTTDMNPYDISPRTLAAWLPMMTRLDLDGKHEFGDPQIMANALQIQEADGAWRNQAAQRGVDATGWSWASKFGDLDNDGFLDLYIVNGMIAEDLFGHLPGAELVEENKAFRNTGQGGFAPMPEWNLASTASGRGMVMADLDGDGDLDIVVNNMRSSAQLFENRVCGGASLEVDLAWPASANPYAVGAQLELHTGRGVLHRDVRASGGYLSGDAARVHFGFPAEAALEKLLIRWPDGAVSQVDAPAAHTLLKVAR
jgi:hypothetical protein